MNILRASILATAATLVLGGALRPAAAQTASPVEARFASLDRDASDGLSLDEYAAEARAAFDAIDVDHNRNISIAEMDKADPQADGELSSAQKITLRDTNQDGILALDEHRTAVEAQFTEIDANQDGSIDLAELKSGIPVRVPAR